MFNPYKHIRLAGVLTFLLNMYVNNLSLLVLGFIFLAVGTIGGLDLAERRVELLEKILLKEKDDEKTETSESN